MSKRLVGGTIGCKDKTSSWYLNGFLDDGGGSSNIGSTGAFYYVYKYNLFMALLSIQINPRAGTPRDTNTKGTIS